MIKDFFQNTVYENLLKFISKENSLAKNRSKTFKNTSPKKMVSKHM